MTILQLATFPTSTQQKSEDGYHHVFGNRPRSTAETRSGFQTPESSVLQAQTLPLATVVFGIVVEPVQRTERVLSRELRSRSSNRFVVPKSRLTRHAIV
ncbi:hypothetical protein AVEN_138111-1 [Araneus ventricosus]|uniref:Uncharacterized protein n=1 Tax=Araneus ventricosus TaxID=182803 RepID=A0A4Y2WPK9_ARAVE|nr:hypothetical protein AVEN_138111-1 [Araneus ventricosus]